MFAKTQNNIFVCLAGCEAFTSENRKFRGSFPVINGLAKTFMYRAWRFFSVFTTVYARHPFWENVVWSLQKKSVCLTRYFHICLEVSQQESRMYSLKKLTCSHASYLRLCVTNRASTKISFSNCHVRLYTKPESA